MLSSFSSSNVQAAATPLSCSISADTSSISVNTSIEFSAIISGGKGQKSYSWDFSDGVGNPDSASTTTASISYSTVGGPYDVFLDVTDSKGESTNCSTTISVIDGTNNTSPVANNDSYSAVINTPLIIAAPGVLSNDSDADGNQLSASIATDVTSGTLELTAEDGSFTYTPDIGFSGQDSFTYFANDGTDSSTTAATVSIIVGGNAGQSLFEAKCIMCHGEFGAGGYAHRSIRGARAGRIRNAMTKWPEMAFLSYLSDAELADIETYLDTVPRGETLPKNGNIANGEAQFRQSCSYCHSFGGAPIEPPRPGPDLMDVATTYSDTWLGAWIDTPQKLVDAGAYDAIQLANFPYVMPDLGHPAVDVWDIVSFLVEQESIGPIVQSEPVVLSPDQFDTSKQVYFNHCAGCHGIYRTGATGPDIGALRAQAIGTDGIKSILHYGTPAGMGNFGQSGVLLAEEIEHLAAYLQLPPPDAPPLPMADIQASWELVIPVANRPTTPQHNRNWENYTGVVLRDAGQVAIIDGDTHEEVVRLSTGFAVHILRSSSSGRYFYAIGRDGLVTLIDLWTTIPTIVANVKGCHDARSVEGSKATGYEDTYLIEGCYWPPQYVVYDGLTLEPKQKVDVPMVDIDGVTLIENRVASIIASHHEPIWVASLKEAGYVAIIDYSDAAGLNFPIVSNIATAKFLHDGGLDHTGNFYIVAANANNKMVVVDLVNQELDAMFETGLVPHPGRGVNWQDPVYGWVNATPHIGEGKVTVYGADPVNRPDVAWQVVREITLPSSGSLFIKSHPVSPWVLVDMTLSATGHDKDICAISKATGALDRCFKVAENGRAVHLEFNMDGSELWVSDWASNGQVIVLDSTTLTEVRRFVNLQTPTGKFNVYNTAHDIY